jgi:hypothetical protein
MSSRPGIKQSKLTKLLRKRPQSQGEPTGWEQDGSHERKHGWHGSFDTQLSLSTMPSLPCKVSSGNTSGVSCKPPGGQPSAVDVLQWVAQFHHTSAAFCSGTKLVEYLEDILGAGVTDVTIKLSDPALWDSVQSVRHSYTQGLVHDNSSQGSSHCSLVL